MAGLNLEVFPGIGPVERHIAGFDGQFTAARHGIVRVDGQVEDHLLKLAGVGPHAPQRRRQGRGQVDIFSNHPPQHFLHVADEVIGIEDLGGEQLFTAERKQLPGQGCRLIRGLADFLGMKALGAPAWRPSNNRSL